MGVTITADANRFTKSSIRSDGVRLESTSTLQGKSSTSGRVDEDGSIIAAVTPTTDNHSIAIV